MVTRMGWLGEGKIVKGEAENAKGLVVRNLCLVLGLWVQTLIVEI